MFEKDILNTACEMTREYASTLYICQNQPTGELVMIWEEDMVESHPEIICKSFCGILSE